MAPERPVVEDETQHDYVCRMGSTVVISVRARGHPRPTYQWFRGTRQLEGRVDPILKVCILRNITIASSRYMAFFVSRNSVLYLHTIAIFSLPVSTHLKNEMSYSTDSTSLGLGAPLSSPHYSYLT